MINITNERWFLSLSPCSAEVPCGTGTHDLRWEAGSLRLPSHPDAEAELVLAALGGERARCVELAETWARHAEDLVVLEVGPRGPADTVTVSWDDVPRSEEPTLHFGWAALHGPPTPVAAPIRFPMRPGHGPAQVRRAMQAEIIKTQQHTAELLSLLALGPAFQFRLAGHVVAAHAGRLSAANRPALAAALTGRLAPIAENWLGLDPDQVRASVESGSGSASSGGNRPPGPPWGSVTLAGKAGDRRLRVSLAAGWLASVWACGLAFVARHLVVAVVRPGWPDAQVLALPAPGKEPVLLDVHGTDGSGHTPHWEI
ncbi:MAG: hypothetical protein JO345_22075 [Streptosporangiaceae bacterium]|nr:hypothetical protein [Streptosporangiaceae bacterium]